MKISNRYIWLFFGILMVIMGGAYISHIIFSPQAVPLKPDTSPSFYTVKTKEGQTILQTGIKIYPGDEYIDADNTHYKIIKVQGYEALAVIKNNREENAVDAASLFIPERFVQTVPESIKVAIYHTHTDESYIPTSGKESEPGKGDVYKIGGFLQDTLQKAGIRVTHSMNNHEPHDINAYHRSRRTVVKLLKETPDAIFDIHRDSAPAAAYYTTVNGIVVSKVMIVIGRSNPNMQTNLEYARRVKAEADRLHPGLMRGIFMGKGDYNQDLYPTALLFEVGTAGISQDLAERGIRCLGDVLIQVLTNADRIR